MDNVVDVVPALFGIDIRLDLAEDGKLELSVDDVVVAPPGNGSLGLLFPELDPEPTEGLLAFLTLPMEPTLPTGDLLATTSLNVGLPTSISFSPLSFSKSNNNSFLLGCLDPLLPPEALPL